MSIYHTGPVRPEQDPWDPIYSLRKYGEHRLTSVELTVTHLCNMRCEHCAVGDALTVKEGRKLPLDAILTRLEELPDLETLSITGGEPTFSRSTVDDYIVPLLKYARGRGLKSQLNSNMTLDYGRYEAIAPYLDVMHISFNYTEPADFHAIGFAQTGRVVEEKVAFRLYEQMLRNIERLASEGLYISAESMINYRTHRKLDRIHRMIDELGCLRHEVHPMYPSAFASNLPVLTLNDYRDAVDLLLETRNEEMWMLFGTLPFYRCSTDPSDQEVLTRLAAARRVTVRNDPDGRNRLNVDMFSGDVFVTDFSDLSSVGNIERDRLDSLFEQWKLHPLFKQINCHCPVAACCGPNPLVKDTYYRETDFTKRKALEPAEKTG